jgi:hypothetical protein
MNMFVGSAAVASASVFPETAPATPAPKSLDVESSRPELRDAFRRLERAYETLLSTDATQEVAWNLYRDWERKNRQPNSPRAFRKWARRSSKYLDEINHQSAYDAWTEAVRDYRDAQLNRGKVRAIDFNEMRIKAAASVAFEGGVLEQRRRHLRQESQTVAWSIAMDAILLGDPEKAERDLAAVRAN